MKDPINRLAELRLNFIAVQELVTLRKLNEPKVPAKQPAMNVPKQGAKHGD